MVFLVFVLTVFVYLLIGYCWAMLFIHRLTDGRWAHETYLVGGGYRYTDMGVGTALSFTLFWPLTMVVVLAIIVIELIGKLFKKNFWKRLYRI